MCNMNPKQFLQIGGVVLALIGVLGFIGILGPTSENSIFGENWYFDNAENWAHLVLGIVALIAVYALPDNIQKQLVLMLGVVGLLVGVYGFFSASFLGANLQNPLDNILHLAIGLWAILSYRGAKNEMMAGQGTMQ